MIVSVGAGVVSCVCSVVDCCVVVSMLGCSVVCSVCVGCSNVCCCVKVSVASCVDSAVLFGCSACVCSVGCSAICSTSVISCSAFF